MRGGDQITVYADVLFLVNFSMDILTLYMTSRITHKKTTKCRLVISAAIGGAISTALILFWKVGGRIEQIIFILLGFITSVVMTLIAFGADKRICGILRESLILWGSGALLGGVMTAITSLGDPIYTDSAASGFMPLFVLCFILSWWILRLFLSGSKQKTAKIEIELGGDVYKFCGIYDSGSFVTEPITGKPVIIVKSGIIRKIADELERPNCLYRMRLIPAGGLGGDVMLKGFVPDKVRLDGIEVDAVIAIDKRGGKFCGQDGLIPSALCK